MVKIRERGGKRAWTACVHMGTVEPTRSGARTLRSPVRSASAVCTMLLCAPAMMAKNAVATITKWIGMSTKFGTISTAATITYLRQREAPHCSAGVATVQDPKCRDQIA